MAPPGLWAELKRRSVVKVGAAYAAAAFVALQLAEIVLPALGLPDWTLTLVVVLAAAGFPAALVLSWAFDLTPEGVRRTHGDGQGQAFGPGRRHVVQLAAIAVSVLLLGGAAWWSLQRGGSASRPLPAPPGRASIAVLPFIDLSPQGDQAYLGDGLAEEILNLLTRVEGLHVAARTSAFAFRGQEVDIREVGRALSVGHVMEGSVRKDGDQIRVTAQLIDVESGYHVWSETYQRTLASVFAIQDEIARFIVEALRGTLTPRDETRLAAGTPTSPAAYEAYLRGRMAWNRRTPQSLRESLAWFDVARAEDSTWAKAHAGLADAWALLPLFDVDAAADAWTRAETAARHALSLDPELAEAHASLGLIHGFHYRLDEGVRELERAVALNPAYAPARHWRSLQLSELGRHDEAVAEARVARDLDPLSVAIRTDLGYALLWARRFPEARDAFDEASALGGGYAPAHLGSALSALWDGAEAEFVQQLSAWTVQVGGSAETGRELAHRIWAAQRGGEPDLDAVRARLQGVADASAGARAALSALASDTARAWEWLERSRSDRSYADHFPAVNPAFDALRADARFSAFLARLPGD